jgi:nucleotide-binding universal stress UspA family protein
MGLPVWGLSTGAQVRRRGPADQGTCLDRNGRHRDRNGVFQRTIVAFDGSNRSEDALALALRLRDPTTGALVLACVGAPHQPWHLPRRGEAMMGEEADEVAAMFAEVRHRTAPGIPVHARAFVAASPARGLTELAEDDGADLLVVGSSRHAASGRIALERTAGRLLHGAPCAVAVAPAGAREAGPFRHVGIAYDGTPEARAALAAGYALAARDHAAVTLLHALPITYQDAYGASVQAGEQAQLLGRLKAHQGLDVAADAAPEGVNPKTVLLHGEPGPVIAQACDGIVDLLVCGSRGYGPLQRALVGSVSAALVEGATHPVLVLPRTTGEAPDAPGA